MKYFNLHTHHVTDSNILEIVNQYPREFDDSVPFFSIGIHPWHIDESRIDQDLQIIENKMQMENCLAVGECGLDKRIETSIDIQIPVFEMQLQLAQKHHKPVIIHCVAAFQELIAIKKKMRISVPMVVHGFSKNVHIAKQLLDNGFYLSFGKYLLRNPDLEDVFKIVPNNRFFLETDTIEESIANVYDLAAKYKNINLNTLQQQVSDNFEAVFKIR